jgi:hypothetical protein
LFEYIESHTVLAITVVTVGIGVGKFFVALWTKSGSALGSSPIGKGEGATQEEAIDSAIADAENNVDVQGRYFR